MALRRLTRRPMTTTLVPSPEAISGKNGLKSCTPVSTMMRAIIEVLIRRANEIPAQKRAYDLPRDDSCLVRILPKRSVARLNALYQRRAGDELEDERVDGCVEVDGSEANLAPEASRRASG